MSSNETKTALRAEIKELKDSTYDEAYSHFRKLGFPEADELDADETGVEWFSYEAKVGVIRPIPGDDGKWGLELILGMTDDYNGEIHYVSFSLNELKEKIDFLSRNFGGLDWKIFSYTWYNGSDEPVEF